MDDATHQLDPRLLDQLPALPGVAMELLRLSDDPSAGVADAADVVAGDPALLARVLQLANSPFYSPRHEIVDAQRAASVLGLRTLTLVGVGFAIMGEFWSDDVPRDPLAAVMGASTVAAAASRVYAERAGAAEASPFATAGLLAFVGELGLLRAYPAQFADLWDRFGHLPGIESQHEALGTDGVMVGSVLMERWGLPEELSDGVRIRMLSAAERMNEVDGGPEASVGIGTAIAEALTGGRESVEVLRERVVAWGMGSDDVAGFWSDFGRTAHETSRQLGLPIDEAVDEIVADGRAAFEQSPLSFNAQLPEDRPVTDSDDGLESELESARLEIESLREENDRLEGLSLQDALTGAPNRPAFENHLRSALAQMRRSPDAPRVGVALFDLDYFKAVNDTHGHLVGDQLLAAVSSAGLRAARQNELFARVGGDEFAMVFRPIDDADLGQAVERVRLAMKQGASREGGVPGSTVSAGAAILPRFECDVNAAAQLLVQAADDALYAVKRAGRDRSAVGTAVARGLTVAPYGNDAIPTDTEL